MNIVIVTIIHATVSLPSEVHVQVLVVRLQLLPPTPTTSLQPLYENKRVNKQRRIEGGSMNLKLKPYTPTPLHPYTPTPLHPDTPTPLNP